MKVHHVIIVLGIVGFVVYIVNSVSNYETYSTSTSDSTSSYKHRNWFNSTSTDNFDNEKISYVHSFPIKSESELDFPYNGTRAFIVVAKNTKQTWAYIEFTSQPNLTGGETMDGYDIIKARASIDGVQEIVTFHQTWGSKDLRIEYPTWFIDKLQNCKTFKIQLNWYGNYGTVWTFSGEDFASEYKIMLNKSTES